MRTSTLSLFMIAGLALAACGNANLTTCSTNADCPSGATCDPGARVCLAPVVHNASGSASSTSSGASSTSTSSRTSSSSTSSGSSSGASSTTTRTASGSGSSTSSSSGGSSSSSGSVGPQGGSVPALVFAIVGDTRPQQQGATSSYPTAVITDIYANINALSPEFVIGTGDYAYCSGSDCAAQTANYLTAASQYLAPGTSNPGQVFLAMGNHECNGYTASNCASDNYISVNGVTPNFTNFMSMLTHFGLNSTNQPTLATGNPYYEVDVNSSDQSNPWTAKFVIVAANAWDSAQATWLTSTMAKATTYTFVVRHESWEDDGATSSNQPGDQGQSDQIINAASYTMLLVGHTHEYRKSSSGSGQVELIVGNGGAETSGPAGFVLCSQLSNGNVSCQPYSSTSTSNPSTNGAAVVVNAAGAVQ